MRFKLTITLLAGAFVAAASVTSCGDDSTNTATSGVGASTSESSSSTGSPASSTGSGGGCMTASDCPAPMSKCEMATCDQGTCGTMDLAAGPLGADTMAGDCKAPGCDGKGNEVDVDADNDAPMSTDCTTYSCSMGMLTTTFAAVGVKCATGFCDGMGACDECLVPGDCPGTDGECGTRTCVNGMCGNSFVMKGVATQSQTADDCTVNQCDGSGNIEGAPDPADNDDGNDCTVDSCNGTTPVHAPAAQGTACGMGLTCDGNGACTGCMAASDCPGQDTDCSTRTCINNVCGASFAAAGTALPPGKQTAGDCHLAVCDGMGNTTSQVDDADVGDDNNQCTTDACNNGFLSHDLVQPGTACAQMGGSVCDANGACVQCNVPADCGGSLGTCATRTCTMGSCGISDAAQGTVCKAASCVGNVAHAADTCDGIGTCQPGATSMCDPYGCALGACITSCANDNDCNAPNTCDTGIGRCTQGPKCTDLCNEMAVNCTGANGMYPTNSACLHECAALPQGTLADTSGQSVGCRLYHGGAPAMGAPGTHCVHAGPGGGDLCGTECDSFCDIAQAICTGGNQQYADKAACMSACALFPYPPFYSVAVTSGDSFSCRLYHLSVAADSPASAAAHCPHIAPVSATCF